MTVPQLKLATVILKDGAQHYGLTLQDGGFTQVSPVPHDPDVPSPLWFTNDLVETIEYEGATP